MALLRAGDGDGRGRLCRVAAATACQVDAWWVTRTGQGHSKVMFDKVGERGRSLGSDVVR